jgi:hypothetical protein
LVDAPGIPKQDVPGLIVDLVTEAGGVDNGKGDASTLFIKLCSSISQGSIIGETCVGKRRWSRRRTDVKGLDLHALFNVGGVGVIALLMIEDSLPAEGVDESGPACIEKSDVSFQLTRDGFDAYADAKGVYGGPDVPVPDAPHTIRQN